MTNAELEELICWLHKRIALTTAGTPLQDDLIKAVGALRITVKRIAELEAQIPKEGEWIWDSDTGTYLCSECNATSPREDQDGEYIDCPRYCPSCGSRMRKGEQ